ncbi:MAG: hypothetical protein J6S87_10190 [Bacteroidales bacterium]|nr:hypothetical protein [Bacteroidales bacterium]
MKENFKNVARNKQARYFMENYGIKEFDTVKRRVRGHDVAKEIKVDALLKWDDAKDGIIFYDGYRRQILNEIRCLRASRLYTPSGMMMRYTLRSEHIPWNVFFPMSLSEDMKSHAVDVFNTIFEQVSAELPKIKEISSIKIEYAPKDEHATEAPFTMCYLNDRTSFDTYMEYIGEDGEKGGIGIEVKYTEEGYHPGDPEKKTAITEHEKPKYRYLDVMKRSGYYIPAAFVSDDKHPNLWSPLVSNELRQIWRNHLLGASMVQHKDIGHFLSLHLYPKGNVHFHGDDKHMGAVEYYRRWLGPEGKKSWMAITFEELFKLMEKNFSDQAGRDWVNYLKDRYLF